jgi:hypothetical protein
LATAAREAIDGRSMALGPLDCVQAIVLHAGFLDRLNHGEADRGRDTVPLELPRAPKRCRAMAPFLTRNRDQAMMPVEHDMQQMWQLASDQRSVRLSLPGLPVAGLAEPIRANIDGPGPT